MMFFDFNTVRVPIKCLYKMVMTRCQWMLLWSVVVKTLMLMVLRYFYFYLTCNIKIVRYVQFLGAECPSLLANDITHIHIIHISVAGFASVMCVPMCIYVIYANQLFPSYFRRSANCPLCLLAL